MSTTFRNRLACDCLAEWLPVFEQELLDVGEIKHSIDIYQLIGGAAASGGTHATGGCFDIAQSSPRAIAIARAMGADATWFRPRNWDGRGGMPHTHGVLTGCPHNGPAAYQITAVRDGFNGLGRGGRGGKDTGPRPLSGRTWKQGIEWAKKRQNKRRGIKAKVALWISLKVVQKQAVAKKPVVRGSVRRLQKALNQVNGEKLRADGRWGPQTTAAYRRWQKKTGFSVTGVPGSGSLRMLVRRHGRYRMTK